jgi:hypothetical protein
VFVFILLLRNEWKMLIGVSEGKTLIGRSKPICDDNIKMHFNETGWGCLDWIYLAQKMGGIGLL